MSSVSRVFCSVDKIRDYEQSAELVSGRCKKIKKFTVVVISQYYFCSFQAHEDGGYIKLIVKEECKDSVPGPVQRVLKSFHTEVSEF